MFGRGYEFTRKKPAAAPVVESDSDSSESDQTSTFSAEDDPAAVFGPLATDDSIYSILRPGEARSEHFDFPWTLDNFKELELRMLNPETARDNLILKSPTFQCGLMADRLAQWHLELDLASPAEGIEKFIGLSLVLDKLLWKNDKKADIFVNAQLLSTLGGIVETCKSPGTISFGIQDNFTRFGWNDFITHSKFLENKDKLMGDSNKLQILLRMDIRGSSGPRSTSLMKESVQARIEERRLKRDPTEMLSKEFFESVALKKTTEDLWRSGRLSDITVQAGDQEFKAHKVMLRSSSSVFTELLREKKRNESPNTLKIEGFEPEIVENLLEYIYTETCPIFNDLLKAEQLLKLGNVYKVRYLKKNLMEHLLNTLCVKNALQTLLFAHVHDVYSYYIERLTWYCQKHAVAIQRMEDFKDLYALDPDFFSNVFKPKTPEPDYFM